MIRPRQTQIFRSNLNIETATDLGDYIYSLVYSLLEGGWDAEEMHLIISDAFKQAEIDAEEFDEERPTTATYIPID